MMSGKSIFHLIIMIASVSMLLVSCGSSRNSTAVTYKTTPTKNRDATTFSISKSLPSQSHALLTETKTWLGTPYKYGGEDSHGIDCSGLVMNVYKNALNVKLPRNSAEQAAYCRPLAKGALMPGDLIFFKTSGGNRVSHVGIYIGDGQMVHSSASKGVIVSNINDEYYQRTFACAGYVEKYHDMLTTVHDNKNSKPQPAVNDTQQPEGNPFKLVPVNSLPQRKTSQQDNAAKITPMTIPATSSAKPVVEPDAEEARQKVLNSLIEQKLDSIFNNH